MTVLSWSRRTPAPRSVVWDVMTDPDLYADAAPNLATVEVVDGAGVGMVRRCVDTDGNEWTETCTRFEEGSTFGVAVDVAESDFHRRLFDRFEGRWELVARDDELLMVVTFDFDPRFGPAGVVISKFFEYRAPPLVEAIFDRWEAEIDSREAGETSDDGGKNALYR